MTGLTYLQAVVIGLLQGVTELFPISSLGHSVLVPAWIGGSWSQLVTQYGTTESEQSPYLAFIVALHVATALALLWFYRRDWIAVIGAFFTTLRTRKVQTSTERLAWLIVIATIPVGLTGLLLEHTFRVLFAKPLAAAIFLTINGLILFGGERLRRRADQRALVAAESKVSAEPAADHAVVQGGPSRRLETLGYREAGIIGLFQTLALLAGISRSGITMVGGLVRGLNHEDAAKFSFLLATPVILAAGVLKIPSLFGPAGAHIHGQVIVGAVVAGLGAYASVRFLTRYFTTRTLIPFAVYCLVAGVISVIKFV
ncbi:undecaprenyl-diphosphate phosphatase [Kribbella sp.]|uniref:undecaprenyl-diphosphate phosphatase n=1 Tax=Kribbella sp. TaxID=1871183 RepID=UPI002D3D27FF|nr:undecaprenyl-diphosphate phosphatase [Kribbella sp.]HZX04439.1 undecaprenyl-diphosphate phosphatase [Kribbella sp.]